MKRIVVFSLVFMLSFTIPIANAETTIPFSTVEIGQYFGAYSGSNALSQELIIKDESAWEIFWEELNSGYSLQPPAPNIDFDEKMVIAIVTGTRSNGCYCLRISRVEETGDFIQVQYFENSPSQYDLCADALTNPYHIISIPKTDKEITFNSTFVTGVNCFTFTNPCDLDEDGFASSESSCGGDDCDDQNNEVYPGAIEICGDKVDSNCDGHDSAKPAIPAIPSPVQGIPAIPAEPAVPCISEDHVSIHLERTDGTPQDLYLDSMGQGLDIKITDAMVLELDEVGLELPSGLSVEQGFLAFEAELSQGMDRVTVRLSIPPSVQSPRIVKVLQDRIIQEGDPELDDIRYDNENGYVSFVLIDNGPLDKDGRPGIIFDPVAIADSITSEPVPEQNSGRSSGGGGCALVQGNSEMDLLILFLPVILLGLIKIRYNTCSSGGIF